MKAESGIPLIQPLCDILGIKLGLGYGANGNVKIVDNLSTSRAPNSFKREVVPGIEIEIRMTMKAQFISDNLAVVLIKVKRNLFIYLSYWSKSGKILLQIIDGAKLKHQDDTWLKLNFDGHHPWDVMRYTANATIAAFKRAVAQKDWEIVSVNSLD